MVRAQGGQLVRVAEQRPPAVDRGVHGGLVARVEQQDAGGDHLLLGEPVALVVRGDEPGDEVVAGVLAALGDEFAEVVGELDRRPYRSGGHVLRRVELVHPADVGRPGPERSPVCLRDPQHLRDHRDGQGLGDIGEQIATALRDEPVHQLTGQLGHIRPQLLDRARGERLRHQAPDPGVVRRLQVEHPVVVERVERLVRGGRRGPPEVLVREPVLIRPPEPALPEQRGDVRVVRDEPLVRGLVVLHTAVGAELGVGGVRVGEKRRVPGIEGCHAGTLAREAGF